MPDSSDKSPATSAESEQIILAQDSRKPPDQKPKQGQATEPTDEERTARREDLRRKVDADADKLDRDYDPQQKPGQPSRIKRAFALLKYVDDPAFDDLARDLLYDPARLRAIARLLTAKPGEYDAVMRDFRDETGPINDSAFFTLYTSRVRSLIGTSTSPGIKAAPSDDQRTSTVLELLEHDLSGSARGDLARSWDVNSDPLGQMLQSALEELGLPAAAAAMLTLRKAGARANPGNSSTTARNQLSPDRQVRENNRHGLAVQAFVVNRLRRDFEKLGLIVTNVRQVETHLGRTDPDSTIRTKSDQVLLHADAKTPTARYRNPQRGKQETLPNMYLFRGNPETGRIEVFGVPSQSYKQGEGIDYEVWRRDFVKALKRRRIVK